MTDRREIAFVRTYDDFLRALRARADELKVTRETIDDLSGIQSGYASKLLSIPPIRVMGRVSFGAVLQCLGLAIVIIEDQAALDRISKRLVKRERAIVHSGRDDAGRKKRRRRHRFPKGPDHARLMRARQLANQEPAQRSAIARKAANCRWRNRAGQADGAAAG